MFPKILAATTTALVVGAITLGAAAPAFADGSDSTPPATTDSSVTTAAPATTTDTTTPDTTTTEATTSSDTSASQPADSPAPPPASNATDSSPAVSTPPAPSSQSRSVAPAVDTQVAPALTCLPASAVSYTYDRPTNSGVITVANPDPATYTDDLCQGFYVTAAAWSYTTAHTFPQDFEAATPANGGDKITHVGTYPYGQHVTCGQGDIYASFDALPTPSGTLVSTGDPYKEVFLYNLGFVGPDSTFSLSDQSCHTVDLRDVVPTVTVNSTCGAPGSITWTDIPGKITYELTSGNGHTGENAVTVTAVAPWILVYSDQDNEYSMTSYTYHFDLGSVTECPVIVGDPSAASATCQAGVVQNGSITVDLKEGVVYRITGPNGFDVTPTTATTSVPAGSYTVTASPLNGSYTLNFAHPTEWPYVVTVDPAGCQLPTDADFPIESTWTNATCSTGGGTITVGPAEFAEFVNFFIDGKQVTPGKAIKVAAGEHVVTASTLDPADTVDGSPQTVTVKGSSTVCPTELKTLALTGTTPFGGLAAAAVLLPLGGAALIGAALMRRRNTSV